jgi:hypothetical protein
VARRDPAGAARRATVPTIPIAAIDDPLEREADRFAVTLLPAGLTRGSSSLAAPVGHAPASVHAALALQGRPLDAQQRAYFEPRLGLDLAAVRIHDDARAGASARDVAARAYTVGTDVVLGGGTYRHGDPAARTLLAHELAHVAQRSPARPVLRRYPACRRLLPTDDSAPRGPAVRERSVQAFLAGELRSRFGDRVERELPIPGGSAAPFRTEGDRADDSVIAPQTVDVLGKGWADIAMLTNAPPYMSTLEILEVKTATWRDMEFAELQLSNYVEKGKNELGEIQRLWVRRGHLGDEIGSVVAMPTARYVPTQQPVAIDGHRVLLAWCDPGVLLFKTLDLDDRDTIYCGISDKGRTDDLLNRLLDQAEEMVARALARRMRELLPGEVNPKLVLAEVRKRLREHIRRYLERIVSALCLASVAITAAAVLAQLRADLRMNVDGFLERFNQPGEGWDIPVAGIAARTAIGLTILYGVLELGGLVLAF